MSSNCTILDHRGEPLESRASQISGIGLNSEGAVVLFGEQPSSSGVRVTRDSALTYAAFWRGVNLISSDIAKLPLLVYRRIENGKERDDLHPVYRLLHDEPNREQTAYEFWQLLVADMLVEGNGYAYIRRTNGGEPIELIRLMPSSVMPFRINGTKAYYYTQYDADERPISEDVIPDDRMLHFKGLGYDGLCGYSVISKARDSLGLGMAAHRYGGKFFRNRAAPGIVLQAPGPLTEKAAQNMVESFNRMCADENNHKTAVLFNGTTANSISVPAKDAQLLETRKFEIVEVANWFGCPPHKLGDSTRVGYNGLEQENLSYLSECLDSRLVCIEQECAKKLLTEEEKASRSRLVEFLRAALIRADMAARSSFYASALTNRWMTPNEVRARENMNPLPGGDEVLPAPNASLSAPDEPDEEPEEPEDPPTDPEQDEDDTAEDRRRVAVETLQRLAKRVTARAAKMAKLDGDKFATWLAMVEHEQGDFIRDTVAPTLRAVGHDPTLPHKLLEFMRSWMESDISWVGTDADNINRCIERILEANQWKNDSLAQPRTP